MAEDQFAGWIKDRVGCHWTRGDFHASTIAMGDGSQRGYVLYRHRLRLAEFVPWAEVQRIVAEIEAVEHDPRVTPSEPPSIKALVDRRDTDVRTGRLLVVVPHEE